MSHIYIGLGANIGDREANIRNAVAMMEERIGTLLRMSSLHETEPVGFRSPNAFLNAVALFDTLLQPLQILEETQAIERELGRKQKSHGGIYHDRPIDIDLLLFINSGESLHLQTPRLTLPHPHMWQRSFVVEPLLELGVTAPTNQTKNENQ